MLYYIASILISPITYLTHILCPSLFSGSPARRLLRITARADAQHEVREVALGAASLLSVAGVEAVLRVEEVAVLAAGAVRRYDRARLAARGADEALGRRADRVEPHRAGRQAGLRARQEELRRVVDTHVLGQVVSDNLAREAVARRRTGARAAAAVAGVARLRLVVRPEPVRARRLARLVSAHVVREQEEPVVAAEERKREIRDISI